MNTDLEKIFTEEEHEQIKKSSPMLGKDGACMAQLNHKYVKWKEQIQNQIKNTTYTQDNEKGYLENERTFLHICEAYIRFMKQKDQTGQRGCTSPEKGVDGLTWRINELKKEIHDVIKDTDTIHYTKLVKEFSELFPKNITTNPLEEQAVQKVFGD